MAGKNLPAKSVGTKGTGTGWLVADDLWLKKSLTDDPILSLVKFVIAEGSDFASLALTAGPL